MKLFTALALTALLSTTAAFAQNSSSSPSNGSTTATAPANASPTTSINPATAKPTAEACKKQAMDKKLTGADKSQYMKDCKAGKSTN